MGLFSKHAAGTLGLSNNALVASSGLWDDNEFVINGQLYHICSEEGSGWWVLEQGDAIVARSIIDGCAISVSYGGTVVTGDIAALQTGGRLPLPVQLFIAWMALHCAGPAEGC